MLKKLKIKIIMGFLKNWLIKVLDKLKVNNLKLWLTLATIFIGAEAAVQTEWFAELIPGTLDETIASIVITIATLFTGKRTTAQLKEIKEKEK